jgi:antitoxin PrlF
MSNAIITEKGQLTIPKAVREKVGLKAKDRINILVRDGVIVLLPVKDILDLQGIIKVKGPQDIDHVRQTTMKEKTKEWAHE